MYSHWGLSHLVLKHGRTHDLPMIGLLIAVWLVVSSGPVAAATLTVCAAGCDHSSIQGAVNAAGPDDTVWLFTTLDHIEPGIIVNNDVTVKGMPNGDSYTRVLGAATEQSAPGRVFQVLAGATLTLTEITISHGNDESTDGGGAILNRGTLVLEDMHIVRNYSSTEGGGIYNMGTLIADNVLFEWNAAPSGSGQGGALYNHSDTQVHAAATISNSYFTYNHAGPRGGGIYNAFGATAIVFSTVMDNNGTRATSDYSEGGGAIFNSGNLTLQDSILEHNGANDAAGSGSGGGLKVFDGSVRIIGSTLNGNGTMNLGPGGAIALIRGDVTILDSTIKSNGATSGGGIWVGYGDSTLDISSSTISDNRATSDGGGLLINQNLSAKLTNVTISGNEADRNGGGICLDTVGTIQLANVTVSDNRADDDQIDGGGGGGIYVNSGTSAELKNSLIVGNLDRTGGSPIISSPDCSGTLSSKGYNIIGDLGTNLFGSDPCAVYAVGTSTDTFGVTVTLGALADNGGPTETHALVDGALPVDSGHPTACTDFDGAMVTEDQRHHCRLNRCDVGAFELNGDESCYCDIFCDGFELGSLVAWSGSTP